MGAADAGPDRVSGNADQGLFHVLVRFMSGSAWEVFLECFGGPLRARAR